MISAEIANINIECYCTMLWPGVHAQVRLGQQDGGRHARGAQRCGGKGVKQLTDRLQARRLDELHAALAKARGVSQPRCITSALAQIGSEV